MLRFIIVCNVLTFHELCFNTVVLSKSPSNRTTCFTLHTVTLCTQISDPTICYCDCMTHDVPAHIFALHHGNRTYKHLPSKIWTTYLYSLIKYHDYSTELRVQVLKLRNNENVLKIHNHVHGQCTQIHHQWTCLQDNKTSLKITDL